MDRGIIGPVAIIMLEKFIGIRLLRNWVIYWRNKKTERLMLYIVYLEELGLV
jgi:hypothetical protein